MDNKKQQIEKFTYVLLVERIIGNPDSKKLVDWALEVLQQGYESENLYILAGLDNDSTEEREKFFEKSLEDLNMEYPKTEEEHLKFYAVYIAEQVVKKEIDVITGLRKMYEIAVKSQYNELYMYFYSLEDEVNLLLNGFGSLFISDLTLENYKDYVFEAFELFLEKQILKIPAEEQSKFYCNNCRQFVNFKLDNKKMLKKIWNFKLITKREKWWQIRKRPVAKFPSPVCEICGSMNLMSAYKHSIQRLLIEKYKKKQA
ncbi:MAG: hypothetical protein LBR17_05690 [Bacteroidales bacterium]|jgi:hypothetical protein|nr:hypothetical protein [Bacteroidales bacterium]